MIDVYLRVPKERLMRPLAALLRPLPPIAITAVGFSLGLAAAMVAGVGETRVALALWLANRFCDGLDGTAARLHGRQSDLGGYLDQMADLVVYAALPVGIAMSHPSPAVTVALVFLLAVLYVNVGSWMYLSAILEKRGMLAGMTSVHMPGGLIEGAETIVLYSLCLLFPAWLTGWFGAMAVLVAVTAGQRVAWALRSLR